MGGLGETPCRDVMIVTCEDLHARTLNEPTERQYGKDITILEQGVEDHVLHHARPLLGHICER